MDRGLLDNSTAVIDIITESFYLDRMYFLLYMIIEYEFYMRKVLEYFRLLDKTCIFRLKPVDVLLIIFIEAARLKPLPIEYPILEII